MIYLFATFIYHFLSSLFLTINIVRKFSVVQVGLKADNSRGQFIFKEMCIFSKIFLSILLCCIVKGTLVFTFAKNNIIIQRFIKLLGLLEKNQSAAT